MSITQNGPGDTYYDPKTGTLISAASKDRPSWWPPNFEATQRWLQHWEPPVGRELDLIRDQLAYDHNAAAAARRRITTDGLKTTMATPIEESSEEAHPRDTKPATPTQPVGPAAETRTPAAKRPNTS